MRFSALLCFIISGCNQKEHDLTAPDVPRGYVSTLEIEMNGRILGFGPFVGYYFKPESPGDLNRLTFLCFNERSFYTQDLPNNVKLFVGNGVLTRLENSEYEIPDTDRINPVFFSDASPSWLRTRPEPKDEFVHFHSCYDAQGPVLEGYWLRHEGVAKFTYDMGGRVGPESPLYHKVKPGIDKDFARIIEFDRGPR